MKLYIQDKVLSFPKYMEDTIDNVPGSHSVSSSHKTPAPKKKVRKIDFIAWRKENHPYVRKWLSFPFMTQIRADPNFSSFLNLTNLTKEFIESYSIYRRIKRLIRNLSLPYGNKGEKLVFFDICSGKGVLSCLLSFMFPASRIYQVDKNHKINLNHLRSLPNVEFLLKNIFDEDMPDVIRSRCNDEDCGILLGLHPCGELSHRLVSLFSFLPSLKTIVLCPCCIDHRNSLCLATAKEWNVDNYGLWTMELVFSLRQLGLVESSSENDSKGREQKRTSERDRANGAGREERGEREEGDVKVRVYKDSKVTSRKNYFIVGVKSNTSFLTPKYALSHQLYTTPIHPTDTPNSSSTSTSPKTNSKMYDIENNKPQNLSSIASIQFLDEKNDRDITDLISTPIYFSYAKLLQRERAN